MKERPQWVNWRYEERRGKGKPTKVPYMPGTERKASTTDLLTWDWIEEAVEAFDSGEYDGVGFVFCSADPFVGLDFDNCRDPQTGEVDPQVLDIIEQYERPYVEVSVSGTGIHLITLGKIRGGAKKGDYEIYDQDRYFCMTGVEL
jgi:primase-polymerase (primpol)-like protein